MAVLSALAKRKLLYAKEFRSEDVNAAAVEMVSAGQYQDALSLYDKSKNHEEIRKLRTKFVEEGDLFLYEACCRFLGEDTSSDDMLRLAGRAEELGKLFFAQRALRQAGKEQQAQELEPRLAELMGHPRVEQAETPGALPQSSEASPKA